MDIRMNGNNNSALEKSIQELTKEIEKYDQIIRDAGEARDAAEKELNDLLSALDSDSSGCDGEEPLLP